MIETQAHAFACRVFFVSERAIVAVSGDIDLATAPKVERKINEALALPISGIRVDLGDVTFLDSSGLHVLLQAQSRANERGIAFALAAVPREAMRVLELTGMTERFRFRESAIPRLPAAPPGRTAS
jgi:anti-sigma B factor antagonist